MSINIQSVTKIYGEQKALDNVSFSINTGEIVGFLGPNGAGKSTMMKIITGYIPPTSGTVKVNDIDVIQQSLEVRKQVGYLPEHNPLYLDMYVKEYLTYVADIYKLHNKREQVDKMIELTGLTPEYKKVIGALSKGYRQRVGLAQALIHDPKVLILDEPTSGLDPNQIVEIRNLIKEVASEKTIMLSTHIMQEVKAICNRVVIIKNGVIIADNIPDNIGKVNTDNFIIEVEFADSISIDKLKAINGVVNVVEAKTNVWVIECSNDIRKDIFAFAVANNSSVLALQQKQNSLEEAFQELTKHG